MFFNIKKLSLLFILLFFFTNCSKFTPEKNSFFVSPAGNDSWSGKLAEPNKAKTDGPFATPEKAREAVCDLIKTEGLPTGGITIYFRAGDYPMTETFELNKEDSGAERSPIVWRAYADENVRLLGGKIVNGFEAVTEPAILNRLQKSARENVVQLDLKEHGIANFGKLKPKGFGRRPIHPLPLELYFNHQAMTLARYPNEDWLRIVSVPQTGCELKHKGNERELFDGIPAGRHFGKFEYGGNRPSRWQFHDDIWMHGYWTWDWADTYDKIQAIDTVRKEITIAEPYNNYGYRKGQRYYFINILEELDSPGEYYLDRDTGMLYFWPPASMVEAEIAVSLLDSAILSLENTSFLAVQGIRFQYGRGNGVKISGGSHNKIAGCVFLNLGNEAAIINGGEYNGLTSCDIFNTAAGGIRIDGGVRETLTPGNNYADNNHIHHFGRIFRTSQPAVHVTGVGNRVSHNSIHHSPHMGVGFRGNENILEFNEMFSIAVETGDVGAFYMGRDWTCRGNVIRYNYFHHLHGPGLHGVNAVYLDDFSSGTTVYGNIVYKSDRGAFIGGGRDNTIENNMFIDCQPSVHIDARGLGWAKYYFNGTYQTLYERMDAMNYSQPPYSEKYPELLTLYNDDPAVAKGNKIIRNVSYRGRWMDIYDGMDFDILKVEDNVIAASEPNRWSPLDDHLTREADFVRFDFGSTDVIDRLKNDSNFTTEENPGFENIEKENFKLKKNSPVFQFGFKQIPVEKIGLYKNEYRKTLPER